MRFSSVLPLIIAPLSSSSVYWVHQLNQGAREACSLDMKGSIMIIRGVVMSLVFSSVVLAAGAVPKDWQASWIWMQRDRYDGYNDTIEARRVFELGAVASAALRITADTRYRLYLNGEWVNDGPSRS
jgi:hypothetical protein